jgi:two-component sensor histidine kinase
MRASSRSISFATAANRKGLANVSGPPGSPVTQPTWRCCCAKIKSGMETKTLRFQCPNTGLEIDSGICARCSTRLIGIRVRCPICEKPHEWQVADGSFGSIISTVLRSDGARSAWEQSTLQDVLGSTFPEPSTEIMELGVQLLDQLNRRLKNNLQMLYGLLQTAYRKTQNTEARNVLSDTSRRIGPMGAAQQVFYSVRNSTDVCMRNARAFFSEQVSINYEAAAGLLPKETPLPLALALNELLTNAAKHGADDRGEVTINVGLSQGSGEIELCVQDRGPGFNFDEVKGRSLGLGLVTKLARRLNGTFTVAPHRAFSLPPC